MSVLTYSTSGQAEISRPKAPMNTNIWKLLNEIGSMDEHRYNVANSLRRISEPLVEKYIQNTIGPTHGYYLQHVETFAIDRPEDRMNYRSELGDKRLLWHGTKTSNIYKILRDGFKVELAKETGMFGPGNLMNSTLKTFLGIYFSDCVSKSANYGEISNFWCHNRGDSLDSAPTGYLLLCEVAMGRIKPFTYSCYSANKDMGAANSVWGIGHYRSKNAKYCNGTMVCPGKMKKAPKRHSLDYNEYIVYYTNQICLKYLVKVRRVIERNYMPLYDQPHLLVETYMSNYSFYEITIAEYVPKEPVVENTKDSRILDCIANVVNVIAPSTRKNATKTKKIPSALTAPRKVGRPRKHPLPVQPVVQPAVNLPPAVPVYQPSVQSTVSMQTQLSTLRTSLAHMTTLLNNLQNNNSTAIPPPQMTTPSMAYQPAIYPPIPQYQPKNYTPLPVNQVNSTPFSTPFITPKIPVASTIIGSSQNPIVIEDESPVLPVINSTKPSTPTLTDPKMLNKLLDLYHGDSSTDTETTQQDKGGSIEDPILIDDESLSTIKEDLVTSSQPLTENSTIAPIQQNKSGSIEDPILIEEDEPVIPSKNQFATNLDYQKILFSLYHDDDTDENDTQTTVGSQTNPILIEEGENVSEAMDFSLDLNKGVGKDLIMLEGSKDIQILLS